MREHPRIERYRLPRVVPLMAWVGVFLAPIQVGAQTCSPKGLCFVNLELGDTVRQGPAQQGVHEASAQVAGGEKPRIVLGVWNGPVELSFGYIEDVEIDSLGQILVLDRYVPAIAWFDATGAFMGKVGRGGKGPGELVQPARIEVDTANRLHVLDPGNFRTSRYDLAKGAVSHLGDERWAIASTDICFIGSVQFTLTRASGPGIVATDPAGAVLREFGEQISLPQDLERKLEGSWIGQLGLGPLTCDAERGTVYHASRYLGLVRAFSVLGEQLWSVPLPQFRQAAIGRSSSGMCCAFGLNERSNTMAQVVSLAVDQVGQVVVTVYEAGPGIADPGGEAYEQRILSRETGRELGRASTGFVVSGYVRGRPFGYRNFPFPQVVVF